MTTNTESATEQLAELEQKVTDRRARVESIKADRNRAKRQVGAAEAEFEAFQVALGAGDEEPDADREQALSEAIEAAKRKASDGLWHHRVQGAEQAVRDAEIKRDEFGAEHFPAIAAEEVATGADDRARDRLQAAFEEMQAAEGEYAGRVRRWHALARYGGLEAEDIPGLPTKGTQDEVVRRFAEGIESPTPRPLLREVAAK